MVSWLPNLSDVNLAIRSLQSTSVPVRANSGMWPCFLELLSGVEAAYCASMVLEPSFLQHVSELTLELSTDLPPHVAHEFYHVVAQAEACDPAFVVNKVHSARLVYYHHPTQPSLELLVIPPGGGLC